MVFVKPVIILLFLPLALSFFCSTVCAPDQCSDVASSACTACPTDWTTSGSVCQVDTASNWTQIFRSQDMPGGSVDLRNNPVQSGTCGAYSLQGFWACSQTITIGSSAGITQPFYEVRIEFMLWLVNAVTVASSETISVTLAGTTNTQSMGSHDSQESICKSVDQLFFRMSETFTYNTTSTALSFSVANDAADSTCRWGVAQMVLMAKLCDTACASCFGSSSGECYTCSAGNYQNGNTCSSSCPSQYGIVTATSSCVQCNVKCTSCHETSTNCSVCTLNGTDKAYLDGTDCVTTCPNATFSSENPNTCSACDTNCTVCSTSTYDSCSACATGYLLSNTTCASACLSGFGQVSGSSTCVECDSLCSSCAQTATNCSSCSSGNYLSGSTCNTSCLAQYGTVTSSSVCVQCDSKCQVCQQTSVNCTSCTTTGADQAFLNGTQCVVSCSSGYFANTTNHFCEACGSNCASCGSSTECWSCDTGYDWLNSSCYNPCPNDYFSDSGNCTTCDAKCSLCDTSATNCSECTLNGTDKAYLNGSSCLASCPNGTFSSQNPNLCVTCDSKCTQCTGSSASQCSECSSPNLLSNTTCDSSCLTGYGVTNSSVCVECDAKCTACNLLADNCSSCTTSGANEAFLDSQLAYPQCSTTCSNSTQFPNSATHQCQSCDTGCASCGGTRTNCFDCETGYGWLNYTCYTTCPGSLFIDNGGNCTACDAKCLSCEGTSTNCSQCTTSGNDTAFLLNLTCLTTCPDPYFNDTNGGAGPNTCASCHLNCASCFGAASTECNSCNTNYTLSGNTCDTDCLPGYGPTSDPLVCVACSSPCQNCSEVATNCTSCPSSPTQYYFLQNGTDGQCQDPCPVQLYYPQTSNFTCMQCPTGCLTCSNHTNCLSCQNDTNYTWLDFSCYNPCPEGYFAENNTNCTACEVGCKYCDSVYDNCTQCFSSGANKSYLLDNSCISDCPIGYYERNSDRSCQACHANCYRCYGNGQNRCNQCQNNKVKSGNSCSDTCRNGYGVTTDPYLCVQCNGTCVQCAYNATNCTVCQGDNNTAYLLNYTSDYSECLSSCPDRYYANTTNQTCDQCPVGCDICVDLTNCTNCSANYSMLNNTCYDVCPTAYFSNNSECLACHVNCLVCLDDTADNCSQCVTSGTDKAYLINSSCVTACPNGTYEDDNSTNGSTQCLTCPTGCNQCESASNCTQCPTGQYIYNGTCVTGCPNGTYLHSPTQTCKSITTGGVSLVISMGYTDSTNNTVEIILSFSDALNSSSIDIYTFQTLSFNSDTVKLSYFTTVYQWINATSYSITLTAPMYIIMRAVTLTLATMEAPTPVHTSQDGYPFSLDTYNANSSIDWTLSKTKELTQSEKELVGTMSGVSDSITATTTQKGAQQLNKAGLGAVLFGGAQMTSTSLLMKNTQAENIYEGARMFSTMVFFNTPEHEQNNTKTKYVFKPSIQEVTSSSRLLFNLDEVSWRYNRTGFSSFFIYDCYMQMMLIAVSWIIVGVCKCVQSLTSTNVMDRAWSVFYCLHEVTVFYLVMGFVLEWSYFDSSSLTRWLSFTTCVLFNLYYLSLQLHVYYRLIPFPHLQLGSPKLQQLTTRYGYFVRHMRYEQYPAGNDHWTVKQWFRPYNYHVLRYYKKFMIVLSVPLLSDYPVPLAALLVTLQLLQMVRLGLTWPYVSRWRNIFWIVLESFLLVFFVTVMVEMALYQQIQSNQQDIVQEAYDAYHATGWVGAIACILYNLSFVVLACLEVCSCCQSNSQNVREIRRDYYYQKVVKYEQSKQEDLPQGLLDMWVARGDLTEEWIDEPQLSQTQKVVIERYDIGRMGQSLAVDLMSVNALQVDPAHPVRQRIVASDSTEAIVRVTSKNCKELYRLFCGVIELYDHKQKATSLKIETSVEVCPEDYEMGEKIAWQNYPLSQSVTLNYNEKNFLTQELKHTMPGFPVAKDILEAVLPRQSRLRPEL